MADHQKLHTFVDWMLEQSDAIFIKKIPILREWLCQKKKFTNFKKNYSITKMHCLVCTTGWRNHWPVLCWGRNCQWFTVSEDAQRFFFPMKPTIWIWMICSLSRIETQVIQGGKHSLYLKPNLLVVFFLERWHRLATGVLRFNPIRLFSVGLLEGKGLCEQTSYDSRAKRQHQTCNC